MKNILNRMLEEQAITPVLVDVGASIQPPAIWSPIAPRSIYVGFDPDLRDLREVSDGAFLRAYTVNKAVTDGRDNGEVEFYFTSSPYCSSTLPPDSESLENYTFAELFRVERTGKAHATDLNAVARDLNLEGIDWIKTDTQGIDLRILTAMEPELLSRVTAIDIEPGLIDAYVGEDLYVTCHAELLKQGFWLADLEPGRAVRLRRATLEKAASKSSMAPSELEARLPTHPAWVNARYLRTIQSLESANLGEREYSLLWCFSLLSNQPGFAMDIADAFGRRFPGTPLAEGLFDDALSLALSNRS